MRQTTFETMGGGTSGPPEKKQNPMVRTFGLGPVERRCKECANFVAKGGCARTYYKCKLFGNTNGPGTDWRANWPACAKFVPEARP